MCWVNRPSACSLTMNQYRKLRPCLALPESESQKIIGGVAARRREQSPQDRNRMQRTAAAEAEVAVVAVVVVVGVVVALAAASTPNAKA